MGDWKSETKDYQETIKDAEEAYNETIKDLDQEQYNADFQYEIEQATTAIEEYANQLEALGTALDGLFENDVNHQKDTLINANSLIELGQHIYNDADYSNFERLKQKWG